MDAAHISEGHARALLAETDQKRRDELYRQILDTGMTVRGAEKAVVARVTPGASTAGAAKSEEARVLEKRLGELVGLKVKIQERGLHR